MLRRYFTLTVILAMLSMVMAGTGLAQTFEPTLSSPATGVVSPPENYLTTAVLWDQPLSSVNQGAYVNQEFPDFPTYSSYLADDFTNTETWIISTIFIPGDGWNGFSSLANASYFTWQIYADASGVPCGDPSGGGSTPFWYLSLPPGEAQVTLSTGTPGGYPSNTTLTLTTPIILPPGHWWLVFWPTMSYSSYGQYGRQAADTANGYTGQFINPGGGFGYGTAWQNWTVLGPSQTDIAFRLEGDVLGRGESLDQPGWTWTTSGDAPWFGQPSVTHDGVDAAQSGAIGDGQSSSLETTVNISEPALLIFWWKVSTRVGDSVSFLVDGIPTDKSDDGEVDWAEKRHLIPPGSHTLTWTYAKDASLSAGLDTVWVDQVRLVSSIFYDSFTDGGPAGDPEWIKVRGRWKVKAPVWYGDKLYSSSKLSRNLSVVNSLSLPGGAIVTNFKIGATTARRSVSFVFDYQGPTQYRYVQIKQMLNGSWKMFLKQKGAFHGDTAGRKAVATLPGFNRKIMHEISIVIFADGSINVALDGADKIAAAFGGGGTGSVGLASDRTGLYADNFTVFDGSVLP